MNAQQLKNSILQEAIEGRLVPQDPNDEPASVLLDRIRKEKERLVKEGKLKKKDLEETPIGEDEKPFEIPKSWEWVRIRDFFVINPKVQAEDDMDAAFIPMEKIAAGYGSAFTFEIRKWGLIKSSFTCFQDGDVAFAKITPCFQNRKSMILKGLPNGIGAGTTELKVLRQYGETINRAYLLYFLASSYFVDEASFKGTANQQRIIVGYLENKPFPLPPLAEQHRIVAKIEELLPKVEEYGKAQEALDKLNAQLPERLKKSILQEAIEGRLVPQDPNEQKNTLGKNIKTPKKVSDFDDYLFNLPESWEWCKLFQIAEVIGGYAFQSGDLKSITGVRVIRISDVTPQGLSNKSIVRCSLKDIPNQYEIKDNDILIAMTGGTVGKSLLLGSLSEPMYLNQRVAIIRARKNIDINYLNVLIKSPLIQTIISDVKNSTNDNISMADITGFPIPLPPIAEQRRIVAKIEELLHEIDKLK